MCILLYCKWGLYPNNEFHNGRERLKHGLWTWHIELFGDQDSAKTCLTFKVFKYLDYWLNQSQDLKNSQAKPKAQGAPNLEIYKGKITRIFFCTCDMKSGIVGVIIIVLVTCNEKVKLSNLWMPSCPPQRTGQNLFQSETERMLFSQIWFLFGL